MPIPAPIVAGAAQVRLLDDPGDLGGTGPDLFLEAVREDVARKRSVFSRVAPLLAAHTPLATISSSILPGEIHPRCLGAHCFFPLEITRLVEAVVPRDAGDRDAAVLLEILRSVGLHVIVQSPVERLRRQPAAPAPPGRSGARAAGRLAGGGRRRRLGHAPRAVRAARADGRRGPGCDRGRRRELPPAAAPRRGAGLRRAGRNARSAARIRQARQEEPRRLPLGVAAPVGG